MFARPRNTFFLLIENKPAEDRTIIHEHLMADTEIEAHREAKKWVESNHNKYVRLLKCQGIGEYAYNSVLYPEDYKELEGIELENPDPQ